MACSAYKCSSKDKLEALFYAHNHGGSKSRYWVCSDSGSTINVQNDIELFDSYDLKRTNPIGVQTTGGVYERIDQIGEMDILPTVYYDKECFINIWCDFDVHNSKMIETTDVRDPFTGKYLGYDAYIKKYDVTLNFRYHGKLLMANAESLAIAKRHKCNFMKAKEERLEQAVNDVCLATRERFNAKSKSSLFKQVKMERLVNQTRRRQRRLGFQSDAHAEIGVTKFWKNVKSKPSDFRGVTTIYGPDIACVQGKGTMDQQEVIDDYFEMVDVGQCVLEIDIMETGPEHTLIGVVVKNDAESTIGYTVSVTLGTKVTKVKLRESELKSCAVVRSAIKQMLGRLRQLKLNIAKVYCDEESSIKKIEQFEWSQELKAAFRELPPGVHAKRAEEKIRVIKDKMRCCNFALPFAIPYSIVGKLVAAAVQWTNQDCTSANKGLTPPEVMVKEGKLIDFNHRGIAHFGELVMAPVASQENGYSSYEKARRIMCLYMHPVHAGSHRLLVIDSLESNQLRFIHRKIKPGMVHPYIPMSIVGRLNARAKRERAVYVSRRQLEVVRRYDEDTGYDEFAEQGVVPPEFQMRNNHTVGMQPNEIATQTDEISIDEDAGEATLYQPHNDEAIEIPDELIDAREQNEREQILMNIDENISYSPPKIDAEKGKLIKDLNVDARNVTEWCCATKKELRLHKAMKEFGKVKSLESMGKEITGIVKRKVWRPILKSMLTKTQRKKILPCQGLQRLKVKLNEEIIKSRLVGGGHKQNYEDFDYYDEISAPTGNLSSLYAMIVNSATKGWKNLVFDIGQAYLNAELTGEKVHIKLDRTLSMLLSQVDKFSEYAGKYDEFIKEKDDELGEGTVVVELDRALYGCLQSARRWYETLKEALISMEYECSKRDPCVFRKYNEDGRVVASVFMHVDDGYFSCENESIYNEFIKKLDKRFPYGVTYSAKDVKHFEYLGMIMDFSVQGKCHLTMKKYIETMMDEWKIKGKTQYPHIKDLFKINAEKKLLDEDQHKSFHRCVGKLIYLAHHCRPDILCSVIFLSSRVQEPNEDDWSKLTHLLKYLNNTSDLGLCLQPDRDGKMRLQCYCDASFNVHEGAKSHAGIYITLGGGGVVFKSYKIKVVPKSTAEAELNVLSDATSLLVHDREFAIESQLIDGKDEVIIYEDNEAAIHLVKNGKSNSDRTKHIALRHFFVKQYLDDGTFHIVHCPTEDMIADILTKPLQGPQFFKLRALVLGHAIP